MANYGYYSDVNYSRGGGQGAYVPLDPSGLNAAPMRAVVNPTVPAGFRTQYENVGPGLGYYDVSPASVEKQRQDYWKRVLAANPNMWTPPSGGGAFSVPGLPQTGATGAGGPSQTPETPLRSVRFPEINAMADALAPASQSAIGRWDDIYKQFQSEVPALKAQSEARVKALDTGELKGQLWGSNTTLNTRLDDILARNAANTEAMAVNFRKAGNLAAGMGVGRFTAGEAATGTPGTKRGVQANRWADAVLPYLIAAEEKIGGLRRADLLDVERGIATQKYGNEQDIARYLYSTTAQAEALKGDAQIDYVNQQLRMLGLGQQVVANAANIASVIANLKQMANDVYYKSQINPAEVYRPSAPIPVYPRRGQYPNYPVFPEYDWGGYDTGRSYQTETGTTPAPRRITYSRMVSPPTAYFNPNLYVEAARARNLAQYGTGPTPWE